MNPKNKHLCLTDDNPEAVNDVEGTSRGLIIIIIIILMLHPR